MARTNAVTGEVRIASELENVMMGPCGRWALLLTINIGVLAAIGFADTGTRTPASSGLSSTTWDQAAASRFLDSRAGWWLVTPISARGGGTVCVSCHTSAPIAMAQASLHSRQNGSTVDSTESRLIDAVRLRVADWSSIASVPPSADVATKTYFDDQKAASLGTESVMNALVLADYDRSKPGAHLNPVTQQAFVYLSSQQQPDGTWRWLEFGLKPWEDDGAYYGDCIAAIAFGMAGRSYYSRSDVAPHVEATVRYLRSNFDNRPLHDQVCCLWADTWLPGVMTDSARTQLIHRLLSVQESDGGWNLGILGRRPGGSAAWTSSGAYPADSISDGYATGLVTLALERAGVPRKSAQLSKAIAWLESNERSGAWPAAYVNGHDGPDTDTGKFMADASAAYAVMALTSQ